MAILKYPQNADTTGLPSVVFSPRAVTYNIVSNGIDTTQDDGSDKAVLYMPAGFNVSDALNYASFEQGLLAASISEFASEFEGAKPEMSDLFSRAGSIAQEGGSRFARGLSGLGGEDVKALVERSAGRVANPREFMLFRSPDLRSFSFSFQFIPESETEARAVPEIIQFFRRAAYPGLTENGLDYTLPRAFSVFMQGTNSVIRLPELVCTSINTTYNPTNMAYLTLDNLPSEISLELGFQELKAITRRDINENNL
jgi:hypothetical protein